jgi:class 3 adenylate cyclase
MDTMATWVTIVGGVVTLLGVVVALTKYIASIQAKLEREELASKNRALEDKITRLEAQRDLLNEQIALGSRAGSAALHRKAEVDDALKSLMQKIGASGASIYVPVRSPRGDVQGLVFLAIEPFKAETQVLKSKVIPLKSLAGKCFTSGQSFVTGNAAQDPDHFKPADKIAAYRSSTVLNLAIGDAPDTVGVIQLLRKEGEASFADDDLRRAEIMLGELPTHVSEISRTPDYLKALGLGGESASERGSVLLFDLSNSALLFEELSPAFALQFLNEYLERMCEIAFQAGATLENYTGDGALLGFNVPRKLAEHEAAAVRAALAMNTSFEDLKRGWVAISPRLVDVHHRAAISTGPLHRATLGHMQAQRLTLIGYPISVAAALCDAARRDADLILISAETHEAIASRVIGGPVSETLLGKAGKFTRAAFEVQALR